MVKWCQHTFDKQKHCCNTRTQLSQRIVLVLHTLSKLHTATGLKAISATKIRTLHGAMMSTYLQDRHHCKMKSEVEHKVKHGASARCVMARSEVVRQKLRQTRVSICTGHMRAVVATEEKPKIMAIKSAGPTYRWQPDMSRTTASPKKSSEEDARTKDWETLAEVSSTLQQQECKVSKLDESGFVFMVSCERTSETSTR